MLSLTEFQHLTLVNNGAAVNILPTSTMKKLGKTSHDLVPTDVVVSNFTGGITDTWGILILEILVGRKSVVSACSRFECIV